VLPAELGDDSWQVLIEWLPAGPSAWVQGTHPLSTQFACLAQAGTWAVLAAMLPYIMAYRMLASAGFEMGPGLRAKWPPGRFVAWSGLIEWAMCKHC